MYSKKVSMELLTIRVVKSLHMTTKIVVIFYNKEPISVLLVQSEC